MLCPKCETENKDENETCTNCGESLLNDNDRVANELEQEEVVAERSSKVEANSGPVVHQRITGVNLKSADATSSDVKVVSNGFYIGIMIATVIFPIIGIIMGFTYLRKTHPSARKAGKSWLIVGSAIILAQVVVLSMN